MGIVFHRSAVVCVVVMLSIWCSACASRPPIVADPPQSADTPSELVPWVEEYARSRPRPEVFEDEATRAEGQEFNGALDHQSDDEDGALQVVVDVLAFPFRGVGWLLQQVF